MMKKSVRRNPDSTRAEREIDFSALPYRNSDEKQQLI
jgi:hypothetical protein